MEFRRLGKVKGDTGAAIVSTQLIGQDANGGNIYRQTFDNGSMAEFIAPKGGKGDSLPAVCAIGSNLPTTNLVAGMLFLQEV